MAHAVAASAAVINITVDDSSSDPNTGNRIIYGQHWNIGQDCPNCSAQPDKALAYGNSWHDTSSVPVLKSSGPATFNFNGMTRFSVTETS